MGFNPFLDDPPAPPVISERPDPAGTSSELSAGHGTEIERAGRDKRASTSLAEFARASVADLRRVFEDGLDPSLPFLQRLKCAQALIDIEQQDAKLAQAEERDVDKMTRQEMVDEIVETLNALERAGVIRPQQLDEGVVDAEVVEDSG